MSEQQQQKEEIERILKEIYSEYHEFYTREQIIYYKLKDEDIKYIKLPATILSTSEFLPLFNVAFDPHLEYALYIGFVYNENPSQDCITGGYYYTAETQLIGRFFVHGYLVALIKNTVLDKDPLSQLFTYRRFLLSSGPRHTYLCPEVAHILPYSQDPSSIFHGKDGIITNCVSLFDAVVIELSIGMVNLDRKLAELQDKAHYKLSREPYRKIIHDLLKKDPIKACDIDLMKSIIHDEIEEAERLMKQYNIIRVAFPLD